MPKHSNSSDSHSESEHSSSHDHTTTTTTSPLSPTTDCTFEAASITLRNDGNVIDVSLNLVPILALCGIMNISNANPASIIAVVNCLLNAGFRFQFANGNLQIFARCV